MKRLYRLLWGILLLASFTACSDDDALPGEGKADFISYSIRGYQERAVIDAERKSIFLRLPDTVTSGADMWPEFEVSPGAVPTINFVAQVSGAASMDFSSLQLYTVTSENQENSHRWRVTVTNNDYTAAYGMGNFLTRARSNDGRREGGFYRQQQGTGTYSDVNCGPACAVMAALWADPSFSGTVEKAREEITYSEIDGGTWWFPRDIYNFLWNHGVEPYYWDFSGATIDGFINTIRACLDEGKLAICCLDGSKLSEQTAVSKEYRTHKFYAGGSGHFLVIKGYRVVNGVTWFEVHDPWGLDKTYSDGTPMGANRYYLGEEVATSKDWNIWTIIVPPVQH